MSKNVNELKVLVIEDEALLLKVIKEKFESKGVEVVTAVSSMQAIDYLLNLNEVGEYPNAIWLDYYLKDSDGMLFMKELKKNKKIASIPVMVVSNSASESKVKGLLAMGAKKYLVKAEHRLDDLINQIISLIKGGNL